MNKIIIFFIFIVWGLPTVAQEFTAPPVNTIEHLLHKAIKDNLYWVDVDYVLESRNTGETYGSDGQSYFDHKEGLVLVTNNNLLLPEHLQQPWEGNEGIKKYDTLQPIVNEIHYRSLWKKELSLISVNNTTNKSLIAVKQEGLEIDKMAKDVDSVYLVQYLKIANFQSKDTFNIKCEIKPVTIKREQGAIKITNFVNVSKNALGIYLVSQHISNGMVQYKVLAQGNVKNGIVEYATYSNLPTSTPVNPTKQGDNSKLTKLAPKNDNPPNVKTPTPTPSSTKNSTKKTDSHKKNKKDK